MKEILIPAYYHMKAWKANLRIWSAFLLGMGVSIQNTLKYLSFANATDNSVQAVESYVVLGTRIPFFMGILLGGLLLLSDAPFISSSSKYEILRIGKKKWFWGQILYIFIACITYSMVMLLFTIVISVLYSKTFFSNEWSSAMQMLAIRQPDFVVRKFLFSFVFPEFINTVSPLAAAVLTVAFNSLYMMVIGCCIFVINLLTKKNRGWIIASAVHIAGYIAYANGGVLIPLKYSLLCCAAPGYHYVKELEMSSVYSCTVLLAVLVILVAAGKGMLSKTEILAQQGEVE